jgi:dolichyl-phosphate beta-glucosyltransferase
MSANLKFIIVIPAFRESVRLPYFLDCLAKEFKKNFPNGRILVVDDGSGSVEQQVLMSKLEKILQIHNNILAPLFLDRNLGKGGAILAGWDQNLDYDYFGFIDADGAVSPDQACRVLYSIKEEDQKHAVFASRVRMLGRNVSRSVARHISGRVFALIIGVLIDKRVYDSQCGFKLIPNEYYILIRKWLKGRRFAFDVEILAALNRVGCSIEEFPVDWRDVPGSKVSLFRDTWQMMISVLKIRKEKRKWI